MFKATLEELYKEVLNYRTYFYNGGGDTDDEQSSFRQALNELIEEVKEKEKLPENMDGFVPYY